LFSSTIRGSNDERTSRVNEVNSFPTILDLDIKNGSDLCLVWRIAVFVCFALCRMRIVFIGFTAYSVKPLYYLTLPTQLVDGFVRITFEGLALADGIMGRTTT
jgi:hypothetical protein